jgi:molybdopterin biosynthesis enzyme
VVPEWKQPAVDVHAVISAGRPAKPAALRFVDSLAASLKRSPRLLP